MHWLGEGSEDGESQCMASGRGGAGGSEAPLWAAQLSRVPSPLTQVGMQVSSLQQSLSIFADAAALLRRD